MPALDLHLRLLSLNSVSSAKELALIYCLLIPTWLPLTAIALLLVMYSYDLLIWARQGGSESLLIWTPQMVTETILIATLMHPVLTTNALLLHSLSSFRKSTRAEGFVLSR